MAEAASSLPAYQSLQAIENQIEASPADQPIPVNPVAFQATAQTIQAAVQSNGAQIGVVLAAKSAHLRDSTVTELVLAAGLGLVGVAASIFVVVRFGRRLRVELSNLYESARQMAHERLPRVVERLGRGEDVDVEAESHRCGRAGSPRPRTSRRPSPPCSAPPSRPPSARPACARAAGQGTCLALLASADANLGVMAYEMAMLVRRMGIYLTAAPRPADHEPVVG
jgi:hypothetical protein